MPAITPVATLGSLLLFLVLLVAIPLWSMRDSSAEGCADHRPPVAGAYCPMRGAGAGGPWGEPLVSKDASLQGLRDAELHLKGEGRPVQGASAGEAAS